MNPPSSGIPMRLLGSTPNYEVWILHPERGQERARARVYERTPSGTADRYELRALAKLLEVAADAISEGQ